MSKTQKRQKFPLLKDTIKYVGKIVLYIYIHLIIVQPEFHFSIFQPGATLCHSHMLYHQILWSKDQCPSLRFIASENRREQ